MGKAYTPEVASGATSSQVRTNFMSLNGATPLTTFGSGNAPSGNRHVNATPGAFNNPTHGASLIGNSGQHVQNKEVRNATNGIPHISMKP
jgi:hypothetical protein